MADDNNGKKRKSVKNIYNENTGFAIRLNLYVIKYIYYHIDKADCFIDGGESGKKRKSYPVYSTDMFPISRQRLDRINKGERFEFTRAEANTMAETYGIDIKYFRKDDPVAFGIEGIGETDWKCFYNCEYLCRYKLPVGVEKEGEDAVKKKAGRVKDALKGLAEKWDKTLKKNDPLFAVCYYFRYGERADRPDTIENLKDILKRLDYTEWEKESVESLKEVYELFKGHYNYVNALCLLDRSRKEQMKKKQSPNPKEQKN